jgi:ribonuclease HI
VVILDAEGAVLEEVSEPIGVATNNVAEYRAVLRGVSVARALGADELELVGDSELVARQLSGAYRVKNAALKPLYEEVLRLLQGLRWQIRAVPREQNSRADYLVNRALDEH